MIIKGIVYGLALWGIINISGPIWAYNNYENPDSIINMQAIRQLEKELGKEVR